MRFANNCQNATIGYVPASRSNNRVLGGTVWDLEPVITNSPGSYINVAYYL